jgi:hypothetical protein
MFLAFLDSGIQCFVLQVLTEMTDVGVNHSVECTGHIDTRYNVSSEDTHELHCQFSMFPFLIEAVSVSQSKFRDRVLLCQGYCDQDSSNELIKPRGL